MKDNLEQAIPKLVCGQETATAFLISNDIAITATHAIIDFFENKQSIKLIFHINNTVKEIDVKPIIFDKESKNQQIIALKLNQIIDDIKPIEFVDYKFNTALKCKTFGYPPVRKDVGTFIDIHVKNEKYAENYRVLNSDWNIDLSKDDDIKDYRGVSGAPLIIDKSAVGVLLKQVKEGGETSRLSAVSLYLYKVYFKNIGIDIIEKENEPYYTPYLTILQDQLAQQLQNTMIRRLNKQSNTSSGLGFSFRFTNDNRRDEKLESYLELLSIEKSAVILSEPGGGKTYLLSMLAKEVIENPLIKKNRIPIILKARKWTRSFSDLVEGIFKELKYTIPSISEQQVEQDLIAGKYLLLVDGLDEVTLSTDLLIDELIKISQINNIQIFITCRKENYHKQLYSHFSEYVIEKLDDNMVSTYIQKELNISGWELLHRIDFNLKSLLKTPLFLFMSVSILKVTGGTSLPRNKAELYKSYTNYLMEERNYQKGLVEPFLIDLETKELILSEYAKRTFRDIPSRAEFSESVCLFLQRDKVELVRKELLDTGLIIEENGEMTFFHPSFLEYFFALSLSKISDEELLKFIRQYNSYDLYQEVFVYLAGLLKKNNRQKIFFDYLEKGNLFLYRICLEARFDFNHQLKENWSKEYTLDYFEQVRNSYLEIIQSHFRLIKEHFYPWCLIRGKDIKGPLKVIIEGSLDSNTPAVEFRFLLARDESKKVPEIVVKQYAGGPKMYSKDSNGNDICIPIQSLNGGNHWFLNLSATNMGIDSAREVALYSVKKQLTDIFDKKSLFEIEPPEMMVTQIERNLRRLPIEYFSIGDEQKKKKLSLRTNSINDIVELFQQKDVIQYAKSLHYSSEDIIRMVISLFLLKEMKIDPEKYLLPTDDIDWEQLNKKHGYIWETWSDQQLRKLIFKFYEYFQNSYRFLIENYFPSLKKDLPLYAMGPIKFNISFYREEKYGGGVNVTWEPVSDIRKSKPIVVQTRDTNDQHDQIKNEEDYKTNNEALSKLGRKSLPFFQSSSVALSLYIRNDDELRKMVYEQLKSDFSFVLGDFK